MSVVGLGGGIITVLGEVDKTPIYILHIIIIMVVYIKTSQTVETVTQTYYLHTKHYYYYGCLYQNLSDSRDCDTNILFTY